MKKLSDWVYRISSIWIVLFFFLLLLLFALVILPGHTTIDAAEKAEGAAPGIPDLALWYNPGYLYEIAEAYGEAGRIEFVKMHAGLDVVWPLVYVGFLAVALSWTAGRITETGRTTVRFQKIILRLNLIPVSAGIFDFLENLLTSVIVFRFPEQSPGFDSLAPVITFIKWILIFFSVLLLSAGLITLGFRSVRQKQNINPSV